MKSGLDLDQDPIKGLLVHPDSANVLEASIVIQSKKSDYMKKRSIPTTPTTENTKSKPVRPVRPRYELKSSPKPPTLESQNSLSSKKGGFVFTLKKKGEEKPSSTLVESELAEIKP
jgi:hypothetical protein